MSQFDTQQACRFPEPAPCWERRYPASRCRPLVFTWAATESLARRGKAGAGENVFSRSYGDDAKPAADKAQPATPAKISRRPNKTAKDLWAGYVNNPRASAKRSPATAP